MIRKEDQLLRLITTSNLSNNDRSEVLKLSSEKIDWDYLFEKSAKECLVAPLNKWIIKNPEAEKYVPEKIREKIERYYKETLVKNILFLKILDDFQTEFLKDEIEVVILKGASLFKQIYPSWFCRRLSDIDLLVRFEDLNRIDEIFRENNYEPTMDVNLLNAARSKYVNSINYFSYEKPVANFHIHWDLINTSLPYYPDGTGYDLDNLWHDGIQELVTKPKYLTLSQTYQIIHSAEHALKHSFFPLLILFDLSEIIKFHSNNKNSSKKLWQNVIRKSKEIGFDYHLFFSLLTLKKFPLKTPIPKSVLKELKPRNLNFTERKFIELTLRDKRIPALSIALFFSLSKGFSKKIRFAKEIFLPKRDRLKIQSASQRKNHISKSNIKRLFRGMNVGYKIIKNIF